ncbi:MAG: extracellular solute-binding protein, partial [Bacillaceae bacterium]
MKRKGLKLGLITMMTTSLLLTACSKEKTEAPAENKDKVTTITFWHAMGGALGQAIDKLVSDFNSSQDKIKVEAQFQGTYDDAINKLKSSVKGNSGPDVMQVYDIGTRFMIDSGYITPMQDLIEKYKYDTSKLEPNLLSYYTVNDKLYSMPFNSSTPIFYYNKNAFKEAGLSEADIPKNFDQLTEVAG